MAVPAISVVVSVYNKRPYIRDALDSIRRQSFDDHEVVVVDDGSTDSGAELVEGCGLARLRLIRQDNQGVSAARNRGISEATAEWVAFLDADDIWNADHLRQLWKLATAYPAAALLANRFTEADPAIACPKSSGEIDYRMTDSFIDEAARGRAWAFTSAAMVRRQAVLDAGGFARNESRGEDIDLWVRLALAYPVATSSYVGAIYRRVEDGLTVSHLVGEPDVAMRGISRRLVEDRALSPQLRQALQELFNRLSLSHAADCLLQGNSQAALGFLRGSRHTKYWPLRWWGLRALAALPPPLIGRLFELRKRWNEA
jgi:glycosyltransferase involved in cell wall biosynthesis